MGQGLRYIPPFPGSCLYPLGLAVGAVDGGASSDEDLLEGGAAVEAVLADASVDFVLELEEAAYPVGVDIVGDGGAPKRDGVVENVDQGGAEAGELFAGELAGLAARADAGAEEAFVGVDVADAVEQGLVEQGGLDG